MVVADIEEAADDVEETLVEVESSDEDPVKSAEAAAAELADET